jgi:hypothetical protein
MENHHVSTSCKEGKSSNEMGHCSHHFPWLHSHNYQKVEITIFVGENPMNHRKITAQINTKVPF